MGLIYVGEVWATSSREARKKAAEKFGYSEDEIMVDRFGPGLDMYVVFEKTTLPAPPSEEITPPPAEEEEEISEWLAKIEEPTEMVNRIPYEAALDKSNKPEERLAAAKAAVWNVRLWGLKDLAWEARDREDWDGVRRYINEMNAILGDLRRIMLSYKSFFDRIDPLGSFKGRVEWYSSVIEGLKEAIPAPTPPTPPPPPTPKEATYTHPEARGWKEFRLTEAEWERGYPFRVEWSKEMDRTYVYYADGSALWYGDGIWNIRLYTG